MAREIVTSENKKQFIEKKLKLKPEHQHTLIHIPLEHIEHGESAMPGGKLTFSNANDLIKKYKLNKENSSNKKNKSDNNFVFIRWYKIDNLIKSYYGKR